MSWLESARKLTTISIRMATAWTHPDGRVVNLPWEDHSTHSSLAEVELRAEGFFPSMILAIVPDDANGLKVQVVRIPELGSAQLIVAIKAQPAAVFSFVQQAKKDGIGGESELSN